MKYVSYKLAEIAGEGHQPYANIEPTGAVFEGGQFVGEDGIYVGTLDGSNEQIAAALEAAAMWQMSEMSEGEVIARAEAIAPVNSENTDGRFVGPASIGDDGRITRKLAFRRWDEPQD